MKKNIRNGILSGVLIIIVSAITALAVSQVFYDSTSENMSQSEYVFTDEAEFVRPLEECFTDNTYDDGSLKVHCYSESLDIDGKTVVVNFADVQVSSSEQLRTAFAGEEFKSVMRKSVIEIAWENNAVAAVNGDNAYDGVVISNGRLLSFRPKNIDLLLVDSQGDFVVCNDREFVDDGLYDSDEYYQSFSFGPALTQNGEVNISERSASCSPNSSAARTAIGQIGALHYLLCTVEKSPRSSGVTIAQLAEIMQNKGCETSYNLCGGRQSDMSFHDMRFGQKTAEFAVSSIVYFAAASESGVSERGIVSNGE